MISLPLLWICILCTFSSIISSPFPWYWLHHWCPFFSKMSIHLPSDHSYTTDATYAAMIRSSFPLTLAIPLMPPFYDSSVSFFSPQIHHRCHLFVPSASPPSSFKLSKWHWLCPLLHSFPSTPATPWFIHPFPLTVDMPLIAFHIFHLIFFL